MKKFETLQYYQPYNFTYWVRYSAARARVAAFSHLAAGVVGGWRVGRAAESSAPAQKHLSMSSRPAVVWKWVLYFSIGLCTGFIAFLLKQVAVRACARPPGS
jgi:hypothetical protein